MDKSAKAGHPKGRAYCDKPGTSCQYGPGDICVNCGRKKGWKTLPALIRRTLAALKDTKTGKVYTTKAAMAEAIAPEFGLDPTDNFAYYKIINEAPTRFVKATEAEKREAWKAQQLIGTSFSTTPITPEERERMNF